MAVKLGPLTLEGRMPRLSAGPPDDLSGRDPEFIRRTLPKLWLLATAWFRPEVEGFEKVPDEPVLFVGNHSGGVMVPDTFVFLLAYNTYFTVDGRPLHSLAHQMITEFPVIGRLVQKLGVVPAHPDAANAIFEAGASALVYPGGDVEAMRPWKDRYRVDFDGRKGFLKLAHSAGVRIVPVVATGGQDTFLVLNDGRRTAQLFGVDKLFRIKTFPLTVSIPWGLMPGDFIHVPFPAKIRIQVLDPVDLRERFGDEPDWDEAYEYVTSLMQAALSTLATKTTLPVVG